MLVAFSKVIRVTTPLIGVKVLNKRVEYLRKRVLLDTGTRTSKGKALSGRNRNRSTDSLQAFRVAFTVLRTEVVVRTVRANFPVLGRDAVMA